MRSRSRAAKRSSASRRRSLTSASRSSSSARVAARLLRRLLGRGGPVGAEAQLLGDEPAAQAQLLALDPRAQLGRLRLALQRPQPGPRLALEVERAVEVVAGGAQLQLGPAAALAVLAEAGRLLDQEAPLARLGVDDRLDPALADHRVHLAPEVGVGEDLDDVDEAAAGAVEAVDAVAGAVEAALDAISESSVAARPSELSITTSTSAARRWPTPLPPAEITSCIEAPRIAPGLCSPSAQSTASVMFDLPEPLGPTITLTPGENSSFARSGNDLNPFISIDLRYMLVLAPATLRLAIGSDATAATA